MSKNIKYVFVFILCCICTIGSIQAQSNDSTLHSLSVNKGTLSPVFNSSTTSYAVSVAYNVSSINFLATAHAAAEITGDTGTRSLAVGANTFTITVKAENNVSRQTYTVAVTRAAPSNDSTLASLSVSAGTLSPAFNSATTAYTLTVAHSVNNMTITAAANFSEAVISGDTGTRAIVGGVNTFTITVTAENGVSTRSYQITVTKPPKITASVRGNYGGTITPSGVTNMVAGADKAFTFTANSGFVLMKVLMNDTTSLELKDTNFIPLDTFWFYNVQTDIKVEFIFASTEARLSSITANKGILTPSFNPDVLYYNIQLGKNDTNITFAATAMYNAAVVMGDTGIRMLASGDNGFVIVCGSESDDFLYYEITVNRPQYIITSSVNNNYGGTINPDGNTLADAGSTHGYTITPSTGYSRKRVLVDGVPNTAAVTSGTYSFTNVKADRVIEAFFGSTEARLSNITLSNGTLTPTFDAEVYTYSVGIGNNVTNISIAGTPIHVGAVAKNVDNVAVPSGTTPFIIEVLAEDSITKKTYTINVTRAKSNNADLASITLSAGSLSPSFNANTLNYTVNVLNNVSTITISGTASHAGFAVVTGGANNSTLAVGNNSFSLIVTAEDGTSKKTYNINVIRAKSSDANLSNLQVNKGSLSPAFHADSINYVVNVAHTDDRISVIGTANHTLAIVTGNVGNDTLIVGENEFTISVTAEDGTLKLYRVKVVRGASSDATLGSLSLTTGSLSPAFNPNTISYTVNVPNNVTTIGIQGVVNYTDGATLTGNVNNFPLVVGDNNVFTITVTAQDRVTTKTYTVTVVRAKAADANLKSLIISQGNMSFNPNTTNYTVQVANSVAMITITGTANHSEATVNGNVSGAPLNVGSNPFYIEVKAEDTTVKKTYTVNIIRARSSDASLQSISVSEGTLTPSFGRDTADYTVVVERDIEKISISATATHPQAMLTGGNVVDAPLLLGENYFNIDITAEDGITKRTYTVMVFRNWSFDANLSALTVSEGVLTPGFDENITEYTVNLTNNITRISINATANFSEATIAGIVTDADVKTGENIFNVIVTAEDGTTKKTYKITVSRDMSVDATLKSLTLSRGTLTPAFSPNTNGYRAEVTDAVTTMTIAGIPNHEDAVVRGNVNGALLEIGENTFEITVTAEDNITSKVYTIVVTRTKTQTGIDDAQNMNQISVYPNPTKGQLTIENGELTIENIEIYNTVGQLIQSKIVNLQSEIIMDISHLPTGLYFVKIVTEGNEMVIKKIIKE